MSENLDAANEKSLQKLAWAIAASQGEFKLILARCNYSHWRDQLVRRLQAICSVPTRVVTLHHRAINLYTAIKAELGTEVPEALIVLGLEYFDDLDRLLSATNQVREEFRRHFTFPIVLWVNDEIFTKMGQLAPDFQSWAITREFAIAPAELINSLQEGTEQIFNLVLAPDTNNKFAATLREIAQLGQVLLSEINFVLSDLQVKKIDLSPSLQASVDFIVGWQAKDGLKAIADFQRSLEFWQQTDNLERQGLILFCLGRCYYYLADREKYRLPDWESAKIPLQQCLDIFTQANRPDLVAKSITQLQRTYQRLQVWEELEQLSCQALELHQKYPISTRLAQDYGFLAEVALQRQDWQMARQNAKTALAVLAAFPQDRKWEQKLYLLFLAQAEKHLGNISAAIQHLAAAKDLGDTGHPQIYLRILKELQQLLFIQKQYLPAFLIKQEIAAVEQQYGIRAFVGAGKLRPQRQEWQENEPQPNPENVAPEILASGRGQDLRNLIDRVGRPDYKLIIIHGYSGAGKSSLVNAGLVPALKGRRIGIQDVVPIVLRFYAHWIEELGKLLTAALAEKQIVLPESLDSIPAIIQQLRQSEADNLRIVLIFDQFEEFFFVCQQRQQRREFLEFLGASLSIGLVKVILSLREDYLHYLLECQQFANMGFLPNLDILSRNVLYRIGDFTAVEAKSIITELSQRAHWQISPDLIEQIVADLAKESGAVRPIELQIVGAQLQAEGIDTLAKYQVIGDKEQLVERYLAGIVADCGTENQTIAELILYLLTDEKGTRPIKSRAELERDLQGFSLESKPTNEQIDLILTILVESGLVLLLPESPASRYQLVHDYLAAFIHQQEAPKFKDAELQQERKLRQQTQQLLAQAEEAKQVLAQAKERAEKVNQKSQRQIQIGAAVLVASLAVAGVAGVWANKAAQDIREAQIGSRLEREGSYALKEFEAQQTEALLTAMRAGQELQALVKDGRPLEKYPAASPNLALQAILDGIRERQLKGHQSFITSASFSPDGQRIVTASWDNTARLWDLSGKQLAELKGYQSYVTSASFSPDGQRIVTASLDNTARVWDLSGKQLAALTGHQSSVTSASFSPDGQRIVTASADKTARVWDLSGKQLAALTGHQSIVTSASFSPDGQRIVTASADNTARLWDLSGKQLAELKGHQDTVNSASFSPNDQRIVTASWDKTARLWDLSGKQLAELKGHQRNVNSASFSPDGQRIVTASDDSTARLWDLSGKQLAELKCDQNSDDETVVILSSSCFASFSPDGQRIVTASEDSTSRVWDLSGKQLAEFKGHQSIVYSRSFSPSFSPDGQRVVTASADKTARLWDLSGKQLAELKGHQSYVYSASFSPDGQRIVTASADKTARLWDLSGKQLAELKGHQSRVISASFSPDGQRIVTASADKTARLWDLSGKQLAELKGYSASFSADGQRIVTASDDNTARVWDLSGKQLAELTGHQSRVNSASFSPDGQRIVTASDDNTARVWDLSGKQLAELTGHQSRVNSASFSPDGQRIVTASADNTARLWDLSGKQLAELTGYSASFSPDGQRIVTASLDKTARVWDLSGKQLAELKGHQSFVTRASFSPDGQRIVTASYDKTARVWDLSGKQLAELKGHQSSVTSASFSADGQRIVTASADNTARVWRADSLEQLLQRGCDWLNNYLIASPEDLLTLKVCQTPANRQAAAPALVQLGEAQAMSGNIDEAIGTFRTALMWNPSLKLNPEERAKQLADAAKKK